MMELVTLSGADFDPAGKGGFVFLSTDDADDNGHCQYYNCGGLYPNVFSTALSTAPLEADGILAIGDFMVNSFARLSLEGWVDLANYPISKIRYMNSSTDIAAVNLTLYKVLYIPSNNKNTPGGISATTNRALIAIKSKIISFVNVNRGALIVLTQAGFGTEAFGFLPVALAFTALDFQDVDVTSDMVEISPPTDSSNSDHVYWHGYWTGPVDWNGLRVLAHQARECPIPYGRNQTCKATLLCSQNAILTAENCNDGIDNDGDKLVDALDPDCWRCGNGRKDPDEECDDGNVLNGDGCSSICKFQDFPPPSLSPSPPPPPPTNDGENDYCLATVGGCATCAGKCPTVDNYGKLGSICRLPDYLHGAIPDSTICRNNIGSLAFQTTNVTTADTQRTLVGTATIYRTDDNFLWGTVQMQCPYLIWSSSTTTTDATSFMLLSYTLNGVITVARASLIRATTGDMLYSCYSFGFDLQPVFGSLGCTPLSIEVQMSVRSVFALSPASGSSCSILNEKNTQTDPKDNGDSFTANSCACPLLPEETEGGVPGVLCNSTYATMTAQLVNDSSVTFKQCVTWPNYDIVMQEMAWSHCWRYDCLPRAFYGQAYTVSINEVSKHNIHDIPAADFELLTFVAPFGMRADVTLNYVDKVEEYNSTVGSLVIQGRKQMVNVRSMIDNLTISYYLPAVWGLDGLAAAVVLRMVPGSEMPQPPSPPANPPSPPSPPAIPASAPRVLITADFMILGNLDVSKLGNDSGVTHSGYYVSIPISFYDFTAMKDCSDDSKDALRLQIAKAFSVDDPSTVFVSCRFAVPSTGEPILRRMMRAVSRLLLGPSPVVESNIIVPAGIEFADAMTAGCTALTGTLSGADCAASQATTKPKITVTQTLPVSQKDACSTGDAVSDGSASIRSLASSSGSSLSSSSVISTGCTATIVQGGSPGTSGGGDSSPSPSPSPAPSSSKSGLSAGIIAGIAVGAVGGVVILAVVGITVKNKMSQQNVTYVDPSGRTRAAKRWRTYSMQQQADAQLAGRGPVPGAAGGGPGVGVSTY
ncbi:hypothetical protein TSOC_002101 [Tetrabaena socialis]|uniref:Uncharacterized protein n=1 Tax=Tetrabaena socialis TaxID=47790 RepID=A0A2J8AF00_9CHLO|nr:hypothetical protein TSOC_002101 [Tetrabaena socialis]|eukprot:PNH11090.1 hypothetical protein TSOC_002101 [Tetrabaena socialis]